MTTIAWDGKMLAADKRSMYGGCINVVTKIWAVRGCLVGGAGELAFIFPMVEWVAGGRDMAAFPSSQRDKDDWQPVMVIDPGGRCLIYERTPHPIMWERGFGAIGSGKQYALAAMQCGKSAAEAVQVASLFDHQTGNGVDVLHYRPGVEPALSITQPPHP